MAVLNYVDLYGAKDEIVAIEKEILTDMAVILEDAALDTQAAFPFSRYESAVYPKWLNGTINITSESGGVYEEYEVYQLRTELQLGKRTEGYEGELEHAMDAWVPYTLAFVRTRPRLQSTAYPTPPLGILAAEIQIETFLLPGDIVAASFQWKLYGSTSNPERDY